MLKEGKKSIKDRIEPGQTIFMSEDDIGNLLAIPADLKTELEEKGLVGRWLNGPELSKNQGYHKKGWQVYRREKTSAIMDFKLGNDPDGLVRRGDCILGYKTKESASKQKSFLDQASRRKSSSEEAAKKELQQSFAAAGLKTKVVSGDDE